MAFGTLGGFLMAWPVGLLSDRFDRRFVIIGAALTATASLFTLIQTLGPRIRIGSGRGDCAP
jgi:MFS family permease